MNDFNIETAFEYHAPTEASIEKLKIIRSAAKAFAMAIANNTPRCADQSAAIRKVREAVMTANAAVVLNQ